MASFDTRDYQTLTVSQTNEVAIVSLDRPDKKNAMNFKMVNELITVAKDIAQDKNVRAVILTGSNHTFCSGIDLGDLNNPKNQAYAVWELIKPWQSDFQRVCLVWRDLPVPVIAVLEGHCLGAGLQLALGTDIRISTSECKLAIMEAKWGLVPDMGLTQAALGVIGADMLKELAMSARIIDGKQAKELGLVSHLSDDPMAQALTLTQEFMARSPDAVLASKRVINRMYQQSFATLYQEKCWQLKLMLGHNRKIALKKVKDASARYGKRQFR